MKKELTAEEKIEVELTLAWEQWSVDHPEAVDACGKVIAKIIFEMAWLRGRQSGINHGVVIAEGMAISILETMADHDDDQDDRDPRRDPTGPEPDPDDPEDSGEVLPTPVDYVEQEMT